MLAESAKSSADLETVERTATMAFGVTVECHEDFRLPSITASKTASASRAEMLSTIAVISAVHSRAASVTILTSVHLLAEFVREQGLADQHAVLRYARRRSSAHRSP